MLAPHLAQLTKRDFVTESLRSEIKLKIKNIPNLNRMRLLHTEQSLDMANTVKPRAIAGAPNIEDWKGSNKISVVVWELFEPDVI